MTRLAPHVYAVVLAGGSGTRFWPKSRHLQPKQLCKIGSNDKTMLEQTLYRLGELIPSERRLIVTHQDQMKKTQALVRDNCKNFLAEPYARNTGHALMMAALELSLRPRETLEAPIMVSVHADALIRDESAFYSSVQRMVEVAEKGQLALLGITPKYPETGYGYIEKGDNAYAYEDTFKVKSFREKPDLALAEKFVQSKQFLWNSGIFAWRIDALLDEFSQWMPDSLHALKSLISDEDVSSFNALDPQVLAKAYAQLPSTAIDHGILEKSHKVTVVQADIGWKDVGSWDALEECYPVDKQGNLFFGETIAIDSSGITVDSDAQVVACIGVKDIVIVVAKGAVLVCSKNRAQEVKKVVEQLKLRGLDGLI